MVTESHVKQLPLHTAFQEYGATFMHFGEWEVPAYCSSIIDEHTTVRTKAGIFDISHMGIFAVRGPEAGRFLNHVAVNDIERLGIYKAAYTPLCNAEGGVIDDIFCYKLSARSFYLIVNALNVAKDFEWLMSHKNNFDVVLENVSSQKGILAVQGPTSVDILKKHWGFNVAAIPYHSFITHVMDGAELIIATTGYTGEVGCEILFPRERAQWAWDGLMKVGQNYGLKPIGFGARDTLRLEAGCLLYGQDLDESITPLEAGLEWTVKLDKEAFIGKERLVQQKTNGVERSIIGFEMQDRGVPRTGYQILRGDTVIGKVTSGSFGPTVQKNIGLGYVQTAYAEVGTEITIEIRNKYHPAVIVGRPFYRRSK